ncbi:lactonase family protein [Pseudarthrobacter sp. J1738]|uniref:lactonase family protein n=1 Tax=unclassified Pseudarthrobacter TaxID=2647000 RepID=UPI003D2A5CE6
MAKTLFVGSYTENAQGAGVTSWAVDAAGHLIEQRAASTGVRNPSYLVWQQERLFAVEELEEGAVVELDPITLEVITRVSSGGSSPCHLAPCTWNAGVEGELPAQGLIVSNYSSGTVALLNITEALTGPLDTVVQHGGGPVRDRQEGPHAHSSQQTPWGSVLVADLGRDSIDEYTLHNSRLIHSGSITLPPGTGPRHMRLLGNTLLVVGELDAMIHVLDHNGLSWHWRGASQLFDVENQTLAMTDGLYPSEILSLPHVSRALVAVRGRNSIAVVEVPERPVMPFLTAEVSTAGDWPRHMALAGPGASVLYVANERSHNIELFVMNEAGDLTVEPVQSIAVGSPSCVLPVG